MLWENDIVVSSLNHTWILDLDGTVLVHNGYKNGGDIIIESSKEFLKSIPKEDMIIFLTSREIICKEETEKYLKEHEIRYDCIIYDVPMGERIVINDKKPMGLKTAKAINLTRNEGITYNIKIDKEI